MVGSVGLQVLREAVLAQQRFEPVEAGLGHGVCGEAAGQSFE